MKPAPRPAGRRLRVRAFGTLSGVASAVALLAWTGSLAGAQTEAVTVLERGLRHIGNGDFGEQCGFDHLKRLGHWGSRYTISFRTGQPDRVRVQIDSVWGVANSSLDAVYIDETRLGWLPASQDIGANCGATWTSPPISLEAGAHRLTIVTGDLADGPDDIAFKGLALLTERRGTVIGRGGGRIDNIGSGPPRGRSWMEALMETTTLIVTFGLLAFLVERLANGLGIVLGYTGWWRKHMEVSSKLGPDERQDVERNRRVALFIISAVLGVAGAILAKLNLLAQLGLGDAESVAGRVVTGLLIAAGADPIRELVKQRGVRREVPPAPVQVTGTVVLQPQSAGPAKRPEPGGAEPRP